MCCFATITGTGIPTVTAVTPVVQANYLAGGDNLTITGTLFVDGANVSVGGTACTNVTFVSVTSLSCLAPAKPAGNYSVVVTNPDTGYSNASTVMVTYTAYNGESLSCSIYPASLLYFVVQNPVNPLPSS